MALYYKRRFLVLDRDNFTCQYCGRKAPEVELQVDHIIPIASGGEATFDNLVTSCWGCNQGKKKTPLRSQLLLRIIPQLENPRLYRKAVVKQAIVKRSRPRRISPPRELPSLEEANRLGICLGEFYWRQYRQFLHRSGVDV